MNYLKILLGSTEFLSFLIGLIVSSLFLIANEGYITSIIYSIIIWIIYEITVIFKKEDIDLDYNSFPELLLKVKISAIKSEFPIKDLYYLGISVLIIFLVSIFL